MGRHTRTYPRGHLRVHGEPRNRRCTYKTYHWPYWLSEEPMDVIDEAIDYRDDDDGRELARIR